MSDRIKQLPEIVANQIAAGEVVTRPSAAVKEMMENSIDAGATAITVNFRQGGLELIQIVDNGCGMSPNDARMAFDRHATSKISAVEDIYALSTFGFRGEALASIAAVADIELKSRAESDSMGTLTHVDCGEFMGQSPVMCECGSQFLVRNLFYKLPARRRFAEKESTSARHIKEEFQHIALCHPTLSLKLFSNDAPIYNLQPATLAGRIVDVIGRSIKGKILEINANTSIVRIHGYIGRPAAAKKSNSEQYLYINGRYFRSPLFTKAILKGYDKLIAEGSTPSYFLYLEVDPDRIDVNVHPQKTEVKFVDSDAIWQIIVAAVRETLAKTGAVPLMEFDEQTDTMMEIPVQQAGVNYSEPKSMSNSSFNPFSEDYIDPSAPDPNIDFTGFDLPKSPSSRGGMSAAPSPKRLRDSSLSDISNEFAIEEFASSSNTTSAQESEVETFESNYPIASEDEEVETFESSSFMGETFESESYEELPLIEQSEEFESSFEFESSTPIAQQSTIEYESSPTIEPQTLTPLAGGYASVVIQGELNIISLRRAHQRVLYDRYMATLSGSAATSQQLLFPERLIVSNDEYALLEENAMELTLLGFDISYLGGGTLEVKGIPSESTSDKIDTMIFELLKTFSTPEQATEQRRMNIAATMAEATTRRERGYNTEQATKLVEQLLQCGNIGYTPAGKAILWQISQNEIKTKLG